MWVTKLFISPVKIRIFCPRTTKFGPKIGIFVHFGPGIAGSFGALSVGWLVARGLYLARHLFTLYTYHYDENCQSPCQSRLRVYDHKSGNAVG